MLNKDWTENRVFTRVLEIIPGFTAWSLLLLPVILAPVVPVFIAYFILAFNSYWFAKAINIMRHTLKGFRVMYRNMKIDWLDRCKRITEHPKEYKNNLWHEYEKNGGKLARHDWQEIDNLGDNYEVVKDWREIYHAVFVTNCFESFEITDPTYEAIKNSNYPNDKMILVSCG